jgi:hypothetical protein
VYLLLLFVLLVLVSQQVLAGLPHPLALPVQKGLVGLVTLVVLLHPVVQVCLLRQ